MFSYQNIIDNSNPHFHTVNIVTSIYQPALSKVEYIQFYGIEVLCDHILYNHI